MKKTTFMIPAGKTATVIQDAKELGGEPQVTVIVTKNANTFTQAEVVIDPTGRWGRHSQTSKTIGGDFARKGCIGFARAGAPMCLIVDSEDVVEETGSAPAAAVS